MLLTLVDKETFRYEDAQHNIITERTSDCVPLIGDLIKDGHSLSSFQVYRVDGRVFRSRPQKNGEDKDFSRVYLLVSKVAEG